LTVVGERDQMLEEARLLAQPSEDYVEFLAEGTVAVGEYHCASCGYGVTVHESLPRCPMCSGTSWEQAPWSPFTRASRAS
jgi:rubredoxin